MNNNMKEKNYLSIVTVLNHDSHNIDSFLETIISFCKDKFTDYQFVFIDNNASIALVEQVVNKFYNAGCNAILITLSNEVHKDQAVLVGIDASVGDFVFEFEDTDINCTSDHLWSMYQTCISGKDIVLLKSSNPSGFVVNCFYKLLAKYSNKNSVIYKSHVHLVSRRAINYINNTKKVIHYRKYAYCNSGLNYGYIEYPLINLNKQNQFNFAQIGYATDLLLMFTNLGKRIPLLFSLFFASISIFATVYTVCTYLTANVISGWTTIMLLLSISFTGIFICLSIVIKYLSILLINKSDEESLIASKKKI